MTGGAELIGLTATPDFAAINLAYVLLLIGAFSRSLHRVRILLVSAALAFIVYGTIRGIPSMVVWNCAIGGLNLRRFITGVATDLRVRLTAEEETVRRWLFPAASPGDFAELWSHGEDRWYIDDVIVAAASADHRLHLVLRGKVVVKRGEAVLAAIGPGSVIGKVESGHHRPPLDWLAVGVVRLRVWPVGDPAVQGLSGDSLRLLDGIEARPLAVGS